jgi:hypothetical protein
MSKDRRRSERRPESPATDQGDRRETERRLDARVPVDMWITAERDQERSYSHSADLSAGGMAIDCGWPHPIGTQVTLRFMLPGTEYEFNTEGEVVGASWVEGRPVTNLRFTNLSGDEHILISKYLEKIQSKS